jgi:hypothetical protein
MISQASESPAGQDRHCEQMRVTTACAFGAINREWYMLGSSRNRKVAWIRDTAAPRRAAFLPADGGAEPEINAKDDREGLNSTHVADSLPR